MIIPPAPYSYTGEVTTVNVPTLSGTYTYNGESQTPVWTYNEDAVSIFGQTSGTNSGTYDVTFSLNSKRSYQWSDGTKADKTGTWSIGKAQNTITFNPTSLSLTYYDRDGTVSVSYLGDGQLSYSINNDNVTATKSGNTINITGSKTGNSIITANVSKGTNYLATSGNFNVAVDMAKNFTVTVNSDDSDMGIVSGGGTVKEGNSITVTATSNTNYKFVSWTVNGEVVSNDASYTFTPTDDIDLTANFVELPIYTITATIDPENAGTITGTGEYREGATCTLVATVADGYAFTGWKENGVTVSTNKTYSFTVTNNKDFTALFEVFSKLPSGYTELQYIESNSKCSIQTEISVNSLCKIVLDIEPKSYVSGSEYLWGQSGTGASSNFLSRTSSSNLKYNFSSSVVDATQNIANTRILVEFNGPSKQLHVGESLYNISPSSAYSAPIFLLGYKTGSGIKAKLYSAIIYKSGLPIRNFVPCTNPSGVIGLYDLVENKFYSNVGTGAFTAGPVI